MASLFVSGLRSEYTILPRSALAGPGFNSQTTYQKYGHSFESWPRDPLSRGGHGRYRALADVVENGRGILVFKVPVGDRDKDPSSFSALRGSWSSSHETRFRLLLSWLHSIFLENFNLRGFFLRSSKFHFRSGEQNYLS